MGGAVFNNGGTVTITNSNLSGNSSTAGTGGNSGSAFGGGVFSRNGSVTILNSTITSSTAANGGRGVYVLSDTSNGGNNTSPGSGSATATINNTIIGQANTTVSDFVAATNGSSVTTSGVGNLIRTATNFSGTVTSTADPNLGALADNGGPTFTHAPNTGSPVLNVGNNAAAAELTTDQRGTGFPRQSAGTVDIGSFEFTPPNSLTATLDGAGSLTIQDTDSVGKNNDLTVSADGTNLIVTDATEQFATPSIAGAVLSNGDKTITIPLTSITGSSITIDGAAGTDAVTLNATDVGGRGLNVVAESITTAGSLSASTVSLSGTNVNGNGAIATTGGLTVTNTGTSSTLSGIISGGAGLTKAGVGTLILTGANTWGPRPSRPASSRWATVAPRATWAPAPSWTTASSRSTAATTSSSATPSPGPACSIRWAPAS